MMTRTTFCYVPCMSSHDFFLVCGPESSPVQRQHNCMTRSHHRTNFGKMSEESEEEYDVNPQLIESESLIRAAIPILPPVAAITCLVLNIFIPGAGKRID